MKGNRSPLFWLLIALGGASVVAALLMINHAPKTIVGVCVGVGSGLIAQSVVHLIRIRYYATHPEQARQASIDARDERTIAVTTRAKAKAFDFTIALLIAFPFVLILADAPLWQTLAVIAIYVLGYAAQLHYTVRFSREM